MGLFQSDRERAALQNAATAQMRAEDARLNNIEKNKIAREKNAITREKEMNRHEEAMKKLENDKIRLENEQLKLKLKVMQEEAKKNNVYNNYFSSNCDGKEAEALKRRIEEAMKGEQL